MAQLAVPTREESRILTALFHNREGAERAYRSLRDRGYSDKEINILMSDATRDKHYMNGVETELGNKALEGAGTGGAIGGLLGAVLVRKPGPPPPPPSSMPPVPPIAPLEP